MGKYYTTERGVMYQGSSDDILLELKKEEKKYDLIFTSPPFPLNRAKKYGNAVGQEYIDWLSNICCILCELLTDSGSLVIEIGNAWDKGFPTQSTLPIETLLALKEKTKMHLCQEFIYYNPAKLPSPIEWVNKRRIRVKDSFTRIWWLSKTPYPKANNKNVLVEYSDQMNKLIKSGKYNSGKRPSEYDVGENSFNIDNGGAIPSNVIIASNTISNDSYIRYCKKNKIEIHPARMPKEIPQFFIKLLTNENDFVLDPFAGSNTTGFVCEELKRNWTSIEINENYIIGSKSRFKTAEVVNNEGVTEESVCVK